MELHGKNFIGAELSEQGGEAFTGVNPSDGTSLPTAYRDASSEEVAMAVRKAAAAAPSARVQWRGRSGLCVAHHAQKWNRVVPVGNTMTRRTCCPATCLMWKMGDCFSGSIGSPARAS